MTQRYSFAEEFKQFLPPGSPYVYSAYAAVYFYPSPPAGCEDCLGNGHIRKCRALFELVAKSLKVREYP